jgi:hypothetical protein
MNTLSRRDFTKTLAVAATALSASRVVGANDRIRLGFIGLGNRGDQVLDAFLPHADAEVAAICDLYQPYLDFAAKKAGTSPRQFKDYRRLLELKDLDAVVICTPDHWHALQTLQACQAGRTFTWRSHSRFASPKEERWSRRSSATSASARWAFIDARWRFAERQRSSCGKAALAK